MWVIRAGDFPGVALLISPTNHVYRASGKIHEDFILESREPELQELRQQLQDRTGNWRLWFAEGWVRGRLFNQELMLDGYSYERLREVLLLVNEQFNKMRIAMVGRKDVNIILGPEEKPLDAFDRELSTRLFFTLFGY